MLGFNYSISVFETLATIQDCMGNLLLITAHNCSWSQTYVVVVVIVKYDTSLLYLFTPFPIGHNIVC